MYDIFIKHWTIIVPLLVILLVIIFFALRDDSYTEQSIYFEPEVETSGEYISSHDPHDSAPIHSAVQVRIYGAEGNWSYKVYEDHRFKQLDQERSDKLTDFLIKNPNLVRDDETIVVPFERTD